MANSPSLHYGEPDDERSARGLVGGGPSQVRRDQAMRVRDIDRPTAADLADAEASLRIVHRNWKPSSR